MEKTQTKHGRGMMISILSLSLLTVMAGAAVAPALQVISAYFSDVPQGLVQMIISVPAVFIVLTNLFFAKLCARFRAKTLLLSGLVLYVAGGCVAGAFSNIYAVLAARALVGIGVGIIMPLSTGLLAFYYDKEQQDALMGYSSAMNLLGGSVATLLAGVLSAFSWRASFLVYLMGLISVVLVIAFLPNERIAGEERRDSGKPSESFRSLFSQNYPYVIAMFLLMFTFFAYPANFAIETAKSGVIPQSAVAVIMAGMDAFGFAGGILYGRLHKRAGNATGLIAPAAFLFGYLLLSGFSGWGATIAGSVLIGFASGMGVPFIISHASAKAGERAATTVMPMLSAALYLAQFVTPMILGVIRGIAGEDRIAHLPYVAAAFSAAVFLLWSPLMWHGEHAGERDVSCQ